MAQSPLSVVGSSRGMSVLVFIGIEILRWRLADHSENFGIAGLRPLLTNPDDLDLEFPIVAVVEQEQHFMADFWKCLGHLRPLHAPGLAAAVSACERIVVQVSEEFIAHRGVPDMPGQLAEEPEGVVEIEPEGAHDGGGKIVQRLAA